MRRIIAHLRDARRVDVGPNGRDVGAACTGADQFPFPCDEQCITIARASSGFCSYFCTSDADCPSGTACIDETLNNGSHVCAETCDSDERCAGYGRGFSCLMRGHIGTSGSVSVCFIPRAF